MQTFYFDLRDLNQSQDDSKIGLMQRLETSYRMPSIARTADGQYAIALESPIRRRGASILKLLDADTKVLAEMQVTGDVISGAFSENGQFFAFSEIKMDRENPINTLTIYDISSGYFNIHKEVPADQLDDDRRSIYFSSDRENPILVVVGDAIVFFSNTTSVTEEIVTNELVFDSNSVQDAVLIEGNRIFAKCTDIDNSGIYIYRIAALPDGIHVEGRTVRNHLRDTSQIGTTQDGRYLYTVDVQQRERVYDHRIALFDPNTSDTNITPISYYPLYSTRFEPFVEKREFLAACSKDNTQLACIYQKEGNVKTLDVFEINSEGALIRKAEIDRAGAIDCGLIYSPIHPKMFVTYGTDSSDDPRHRAINGAIDCWDARDPENPDMFDSKRYDNTLVPSLLIADRNRLLIQCIKLSQNGPTLEGTYMYEFATMPALPVQSLSEAGKATLFKPSTPKQDALEGELSTLNLGAGAGQS